jgi:hypothetical protein
LRSQRQFPRRRAFPADMKLTILRCAAVTAVVLGLAAPAAPAAVGPDYVSSDNVDLVSRLKEAGTGVGARIVGDYMYVTSTHALLIYDIKSNPAAPALQGAFTLNVQFENEEVPTNGKILAISSDTFCVPVDPNGIGSSGTAAQGGCLAIYDVKDPANVKLLSVVNGVGDHTSTCVFDCKYFFGNDGSLTDATDPANPKVIEGGWKAPLEEGDNPIGYCHHIRELDPGIILGACNPVALFTVRAEDGADPQHPKLIATGDLGDTRLVHSNRWPRNGRDRWVLVGGETNASGTCDDTVGAFMTYDAKSVVKGGGAFNFGSAMTRVDEFRPTSGTYTDGKSPYNVLGCSVHWFEEHPTFKNGGLVALAAYENGERFMQVTPDGKLVEQGWYLPGGGSTSAPHWNPFDPSILYSIDYTRGVEVLKYTGDTYVPNGNGDVVPTPGATPGTNGKGPNVPACASAAGFNKASISPKGKSVKFTVDRREKKPFSVEVFQQTQGRKVIGNRLVARFKGKKKSFAWNGKDRKGRRLSAGNYFVRFKMKTSNGATDTRRATLAFKGGRFKNAPDFYQRVDCGIYKSLKLSSSAFGGTTNAPLGIAYKLAVPAKAVTIKVSVGSKVIKTFTGGGEVEKTYRFKLPAKAVKRGKVAKVVVTADRPGQATTSITLAANRL